MADPLQFIDRTFVRWQGRRLVYFGGSDYFRLASEPAVVQAVHEGLDRYGLNMAASRRTTGNHAIYGRLEAALARFFRVEAAVLLSSGYFTNIAVAQALAGEVTHVLADERTHFSSLDAARLLGCPLRFYPHRQAARAAALARRLGASARILLLTDGLFSHSGQVAPVDELLRELPRNVTLLVDDAHGAGTLGRTGGGTLEHLGVRSTRVIRTITFSKAFGVYGGAVLGTRRLAGRLVTRSPVYTGNTPLPPPLAHGALAALEVLRRDAGRRRRLVCNTGYVKAALAEAGLDLPDGPGPIVPVHPRDPREAARLRRRLLRAGIHPPLIRYAGDQTSYFRFALSSEHTPAQLDALVGVLRGDA